MWLTVDMRYKYRGFKLDRSAWHGAQITIVNVKIDQTCLEICNCCGYLKSKL